MRLRFLLTVAAATSLVLLAFLLPLAVLVGAVSQNRATNAATLQVQPLVPLVGTVGQESLQLAVDGVNEESSYPTTVFLPNGAVLGAPAARSDSVALAAQGQAFTADTAGGREVLVPVQGLPGGTAVIRVFVPSAELEAGVARARAVLVLLGLVLLGLALLVGDQVARSFLVPVRALSTTARRLAAGDLEARVSPSGPPEIQSVGRALNRLAGRIGTLLAAEREAVADLSHRLRTPVTALRLDADGLRDPEERVRVSDDVEELSRMVDEVIREARRPVREGLAAACDGAAVVADRVRFWQVLAEDQGRRFDVDLPTSPVPVKALPDDLASAVDALFGNVFAHTPDGTGFEVRLTRLPQGGGRLVFRDAGPGLPAADVTARGASGSGSSGLGLDIVRRTAEASGGALTVRTARPQGAEVVVDLGPPDSG